MKLRYAGLLIFLLCLFAVPTEAKEQQQSFWLIFFIGIHDAGPAPPTIFSDGVTFRVEVIYAGKKECVFKKHWQDREWLFEKVDLSKYQEKEVKIRFVVNPGPDGDPYADWACWGEPRVVIYRTRGNPDDETLKNAGVLYDFVENYNKAVTGINGKECPLSNGAKFSLDYVPVPLLTLERGVKMCGGVKKRAIYAEPAWDGISAESFGEFTIKLRRR